MAAPYFRRVTHGPRPNAVITVSGSSYDTASHHRRQSTYAGRRRDWHPRDGGIVELQLHCAHDLSLGFDVEIEITARPVEETVVTHG